jgi:alkylhydroperoxidase family enzyme
LASRWACSWSALCWRRRSTGLSDDEIWDVGAITALFAMSNRLAHLMALQPNDEFFTMARAARGPS